MDKVWGVFEGSCAWCFRSDAVKEYEGEMAGGEHVMYQVCDECFKEQINAV
jgi:hypothetical protein